METTTTYRTRTPGSCFDCGAMCNFTSVYCHGCQARHDRRMHAAEEARQDGVRGLVAFLDGMLATLKATTPAPVAPATVTVRSESRADVSYVVRRDATGAVSCTCPGFRFRRSCKHANALSVAA